VGLVNLDEVIELGDALVMHIVWVVDVFGVGDDCGWLCVGYWVDVVVFFGDLVEILVD